MDTDYNVFLQNGVAIVVLMAIGMFFWKKAWPFTTKQIEDARIENRKIIENFLITLERRDSQFDRIVQELHRLTEELKRLGNLIEARK